MASTDTTRPRVTPGEPVSTDTGRVRRGFVPPEERARLRQSFGHALWTARITANLTQAGLAERAGMSTRSIERLETGAQRPTDGTTLRLARVLRPRAELVDVVALDVDLQDAAGSSLRKLRRRKPRPQAYQRALEDVEQFRRERAEAADFALGLAVAALNDRPDLDALFPAARRRPQVRS